MAVANLSTTQSMVYAQLNVDAGSYGTYVANARYLSSYIDAEIFNADIRVCQILAKRGQEILLSDSWQTQSISSTGTALNLNWIIVGVDYNSGSAVYKKAIEIEYSMYEQIVGGGIYNVTDYKGYYTIQNGKIYFIAPDIKVYYLNFARSGSLRSPDGMEPAIAYLASSVLLMKRGDQPEQSAFYYKQFEDFMSAFMAPDENNQEEVEKGNRQ